MILNDCSAIRWDNSGKFIEFDVYRLAKTIKRVIGKERGGRVVSGRIGVAGLKLKLKSMNMIKIEIIFL